MLSSYYSGADGLQVDLGEVKNLNFLLVEADCNFFFKYVNNIVKEAYFVL